MSTARAARPGPRLTRALCPLADPQPNPFAVATPAASQPVASASSSTYLASESTNAGDPVFGNGGAGSSSRPPLAAAAAGASGDIAAQLKAERAKAQLLEKQLEEKTKEFEAKEAKLREEMANMKGPRQPNFPKCYPVTYHNIALDIKPERRALQRFAFTIWLYTSILYLFTWINVTGSFFGGSLGKVLDDPWLSFFVATFVLILGPFLSWFLWYRLLYKIYRKNKGTYFIFALNFVSHLIYCCYNIIGVYYGTAGLVFGIRLHNYGKNELCSNEDTRTGKCSQATTFSWMYIICFVAWTVNALMSLWLAWKVYSTRSPPSKIEKAKKAAIKAAV